MDGGGGGGGAPPPALAAAGCGRRPAAAIKAIDREAVHRICSGQVILDLATAVKELVENALDAGATAIEIRLKEYGSELLEVADNGHGVSPDNYQALTLKYHTSKIEGFDDLQELATFGFRGEALSSLCAVADVSVVTRTVEQDVGVRLSYDHNGKLVGQAGAARTVGTTVAVRDLFKRLPVRHKEFLRHIKREYARLVGLLQAYALICTGVRLVCTNQVGNGARTTVVTTQGGRSIRDNILAVFGGKAAEGMEPLEVQVDADGTPVTISGWVSKATANSGRAAGDRQFFFLNGRPVDLPKATKALNECYRALSSPAAAASKPMAVVDFRLPPDTYDVNVTPDKRKVFLHAEKKVLAALTEGLQALWEPSRNTYAVNDAVAAQQAQQAQRGGSQAVAAGPRSVPAFSHFAASQAQGAAAEAEDGEEEGAAVAQSPADDAGEPSAKRRAVLPLAAFALGGGGGSQAAASPAGQQQAQQQQSQIQQLSQQQQQQQGSKQRSLLSFGFQREQQPPASDKEQRSEGAVEAAEAEAQELNQDGRGEPAALAAAGTEQQAAATAAVLQATPQQPGGTAGGAAAVGGGGSSGAAQRQAAREEESEDDAMYELSDEELQPQQAQQTAQQAAQQAAQQQGSGMPAAAAAAGRQAAVAAAAAEQEAGDEETDAAVVYATSSSGDITAAVDLASMRQRLLAAARASAEAGGGAGGSRQAAAGRRSRSRFGAASLAAADPGAGAADAAGLAGMSREQAEQVAEQELQRVFDKADFRRLEVLGQFNLGFILARLDRDLFIVDQHASDEKHNFERLQRTTTLNRQPLLAPQPLELSPTEALTVRDSLDVFRQNGFEFRDEPGSGRLLLAAVPFSVRAMLASRACRSSIMIGKALQPRTMRQILDHLAELESPWNCPHGRPTMRHLALLPPPQPPLQP
ncbi:hypothetical protein COHA_009815 [Chlorella ohadii]|uniref:Uncharacterized protein n=1 Tax=Chlorella ohadii TaxID=2649997 RepID=A0AAD5DEU8_9CHLO|nr:hypothetical protein COHA_009815 [Chlorella ohadii]